MMSQKRQQPGKKATPQGDVRLAFAPTGNAKATCIFGPEGKQINNGFYNISTILIQYKIKHEIQCGWGTRSYSSTITTRQKRHVVVFPQMTQLVTPNKV